MSEVSSPRAKLVELLWQLKQASDRHDSGRDIHFNTLLRDSAYRRELIDDAAMSPVREIRDLGLSLRVLNTDGELTWNQRPGASGSDAAGVPVNPDIAETVGQRHSSPASPSKSASNIWLYVGAGLVVLIALVVIAASALGPSVQTVRGSLYGEQRWTADTTWVLEDIVYLESGSQLIVEPGTIIQGEAGSALVVTRDATIMARGTREAPIVFTSAKAAGQRRAGDWGGVVLLGNAPVNARDAQIEGVPSGDSRGMFGGGDALSNCGVLEYARVEFAGYEVYANNELNGLTLGGCGASTIVRNVQVHRSLDDGIEVFGGTVDLRHIVITGAADDSLDWDMGWTGRVQFLQVLQYAGIGDNGVEADNNNGDHNAQPVSEPTFYNVTLQSMSSTDAVQRGMTLRRGTGGHFNNMIIDGFSGEAIDIKDVETVARLDSRQLSFKGLLISNIGRDGSGFFAAESSADSDDDGGFDEARYFRDVAQLGVAPQFRLSAIEPSQPEFRLQANSPAREGAATVPEDEFWDESADYIGAVRPGANTTWMEGWTAFPAD